MLLGTAKVLMGIRDQFAGTVKLFFQHAEERNPGGAKFMVEAGVLDGVEQVYGFHVMRGPKGTVQAARGCATSSAGGFFATIQGVGSHGSMPHKGIDPALCAAQIVVALNHIVSRSIDPWHFTVVNPGFIASGAAPNVVPDSARVGCSIRTYTPEATEIACRRSEEVVEGICRAYGCSYEIDWVPPYDIVDNDIDCVDIALTAARKAVGETHVSECGPMSGSEDFSEFTKRVPGCLVFFNGGDSSDGFDFENHHPKFSIHEDILEGGVATEVQIVLDVLGARATAHLVTSGLQQVV
jgi:amidohydrolase